MFTPDRHRQHRVTIVVTLIIAVILSSSVLTACSINGSGPTNAEAAASQESAVAKQIQLYTALRTLWSDHMQYTYRTINAFYHNQAALQPTLDRLLQNQQALGAAIVPFYGQQAGDKLGALLTAHIKLAVPVLTAAKSGDKVALNKALDDWYANAKQIADFLSAANPKSWPTSVTEPMLKAHITQTTAYAVDLLNGDYAKSNQDYDVAFRHMMMMSDAMAQGLITQFPSKFAAH